MASQELRRAWAEIIEPEDYETHMAAIGQAEANAHLIKELIDANPLDQGARLLFAGAGTGQMFDYISPAFLQRYCVSFTDIRDEFLDKLRGRLAQSWTGRFEVFVDDIERPTVGVIDGAALVLVLEHVDWQRALTGLIDLGVRNLYLIIQINPPEMGDMVAPNRVLPPSMARVPPEAKSELVDPIRLEEFLGGHVFSRAVRIDVPVADGKTMAGFVFRRV